MHTGYSWERNVTGVTQEFSGITECEQRVILLSAATPAHLHSYLLAFVPLASFLPWLPDLSLGMDKKDVVSPVAGCTLLSPLGNHSWRLTTVALQMVPRFANRKHFLM